MGVIEELGKIKKEFAGMLRKEFPYMTSLTLNAYTKATFASSRVKVLDAEKVDALLVQSQVVYRKVKLLGDNLRGVLKGTRLPEHASGKLFRNRNFRNVFAVMQDCKEAAENVTINVDRVISSTENAKEISREIETTVHQNREYITRLNRVLQQDMNTSKEATANILFLLEKIAKDMLNIQALIDQSLAQKPRREIEVKAA